MTATLLDEMRTGIAPPIVPISVDQLEQMLRAGILQDGQPIELIDGLLVRKDRSSTGEDAMTHNPAHATLVARLVRRILLQCQDDACAVRSQLPIVLGDLQALEPDLVVVRGADEDYTTQHPGPSDVLLVVEVADSSLRFDRSTKHRLYATAGIAAYWLINLQDNRWKHLRARTRLRDATPCKAF